jgi:hypothetical protein
MVSAGDIHAACVFIVRANAPVTMSDIRGMSLTAHLVQEQQRGDEKRWAMTGGLINDPKHWRTRAGEARRLAAEMPDEVSKQMMLGVAEDYDRLAERADLRAKDVAQIGVGRLNDA